MRLAEGERGYAMSVITISRGSYSHGKEVAEKVADRLGYKCIAREVLLEASEHFNVPEVKLLEAIRDAPSFLERLAHGRLRYIAFIRLALLRQIQEDNVVYHGFAGHLILRDIPHVLKVRILADLEDRVGLVMNRDGVSRGQALKIVKRLDEERRRWSRSLYGIDTGDPGLYDLVVNLRRMTLESAADVICHTAGLKEFQITAESHRMINDLLLAAEVQMAVAEMGVEAAVVSRDGSVEIVTKAPSSQERGLTREIERRAMGISGVKAVRVEITPLTLFE